MMNSKFKILVIMLFVFLIVSIAYAGDLVEVDGFIMYKTSSGEYAKDCFIWLDMNGDSVKECFRFDENGHIAKNYIGHDGRETNEFGQLIENGIVIKKLSSGKIISGKGELLIDERSDEKIINKTDNKFLKELPFDTTNRNSDKILTTKIEKDIKAPIDGDLIVDSNIIYSKDKSGKIIKESNDYSEYKKQIVAGKNINKYIIEKHNTKVDVEKVNIYGNEVWEDVIELRGHNSFIKIDVKDFNYMYFEVAEKNHIENKDDDSTLSLDIYIDGKPYEILDEFVESEPQIVEIDDLDGKVLELKVNAMRKNRRVYIRNGRLKKIREKDE